MSIRKTRALAFGASAGPLRRPVLRGELEDRQAAPHGVEVVDLEWRLASALARSPSRGPAGGPMGGLDTEEDLGRRGAAKALMRPEAEVVAERRLEPVLEGRPAMGV